MLCMFGDFDEEVCVGGAEVARKNINKQENNKLATYKL